MANKNKSNNSADATTGGSKFNKQKSDDSKDYSSFKIVLFYCSLILVLPVVTFFSIKSLILDRLFTLTEVATNIYSAVAAVIALHLALGVYIYRAYFGGSSESREKAD